MGIFEEFTDQVDETLLCPICHGVLDRPHVYCAEGHTYCEACIKAWTAPRRNCPECRRPSLGGENNVGVRNRVLERLVAKLGVKCGACEWEGRLEQLQKHRDRECSRRSVACRLNCGWLGRCTDEEAHVLNACTKYERECHNGCGVTFQLPPPHGDKGIHASSGLAKNDDAGETETEASCISPETHYRVCPLEPVSCVFEKFGCGARVPRQDVAAHQAQAACIHESLCTSALAKLQEQLTNLNTLHSNGGERRRPEPSDSFSLTGANTLLGPPLLDHPALPFMAHHPLPPHTPLSTSADERGPPELLYLNGWTVGEYVMVKDADDDVWYFGRITRVCPQRYTLTLHFLGFNSLWFDREIRADSRRLRRPQPDELPPPDWRHSIRVSDAVEILHPYERYWLHGEVTIVNASTGQVYVRVDELPAISRWIHSYSNEIRRPLPLPTRTGSHAESTSTTTTTPSPFRLALDSAATTQRGPSSIITDERLMTLLASGATSSTTANNH